MYGLPLPLFAAEGVPPPIVPIDVQNITTPQATIDIAWGDQVFEEVFILLDNVIPSVNGVALDIRTSSDNGGSFDSAAANYPYNTADIHTSFTRTAQAATALELVQNGATDGLDTLSYGCFAVQIIQPSDAVVKTVINGWGGYVRAANNAVNAQSHGRRDSAGLVNAIRFAARSGNLSGRFQAWGLVL